MPENIALSQKQKAPLLTQTIDCQHEWEASVLKKRLVFLPTPIDRESPSRKTNRHEAELIAGLVKFFQKNDLPVNGDEQSRSEFGTNNERRKSIGIITPYRAQIAQIQEVLQSEGIDCSGLTIDTVERYQGGAARSREPLET